MESADIVLMRSDLMDVPTAIKLSKETMKNIKQNLSWGFAYNTIGIPIAAAMSLSSVAAIANALRLKNFKQYK